MADFTSALWEWYIVVPTVLGIVWLSVMVVHLARGRRDVEGEPQTMGHVWDEDLEEYNNPLPRWWLNLFYVTLVFGVVYLILYPGLGSFPGLLGWSGTGQYDEEMAAAEERYGPLYERYLSQPLERVAQEPEALKMGERLFVTYCATCHGSDARGAVGFPNLRDSEWLYGRDPENVARSIAEGRQGVMPAWGEVLGEVGVVQVAEYVLSLSGREFDASQASAGKARYETLCAACHQLDGSGNPALGAPALNNRIWQYGGSEQAIRQSIRGGRQGVMPAHRDLLGDAKVHLLAAYVISLRDR